MPTSDTWHPPQVDGSRHDLCELRQIERLVDYGEKPFAHDPLSPRDEDYWHGDTRAPKGLENIPPREARHQHIEQNDVRLDRRHGGEDFGASRHCRDVVALADEEVAQQLEDVRLVIGDQNSAIAAITHGAPPIRGTVAITALMLSAALTQAVHDAWCFCASQPWPLDEQSECH